MKRDRDYVIKEGQVIIVDEFTGRLMFGRRYSEGLHQAIEAKENVKIERESQTLATITFQNYFRMYDKLAGMTGTAETEELEFRKIYGLSVVVVPTNLPMIRTDYPDVIYKTAEAKFKAVIAEIEEIHQTGRPVLVGTISIEKSEALSAALRKKGIPHQVLNAKYHEQEAQIIAQAGRLGMVTIATNMAGRGTDIILGGNAEALARELVQKKNQAEDEDPAVLAAALAEAKHITEQEHDQVVKLGGLHIIGTERHESRRIDNQLRGRAGRQGDPGSSRFFVAMGDDLMRLFGGEMIVHWMERLGWEEEMPIEHPRIAKAIENAQRKVEGRNFGIRKQVLEYDDVLNKQRATIYSLRQKLLMGEDLKDQVLEALETVVDQLVLAHTDARSPEEWEYDNILKAAEQSFLPLKEYTAADLEAAANGETKGLKAFFLEAALKFYAAKEARVGAVVMRDFERYIMLRTIDTLWIDHLQNMDDLREGVGLRAYGQQDPLVVYKIETYQMFQELLYAIKEDVVRYVFKLELSTEAPRQERRISNIVTNRGEDGAPAVQQRKTGQKVGRNEPCPCGSGKKYKKCCGAN
jgi:preprotein translocase subunit SecA